MGYLKKDKDNLKLYIIRGGSMYPSLRGGDRAIVSLQKTPQIGDVVIFRDTDNRLIVHRLIKKQGDYVVTRGDNHLRFDEKRPIQGIEGVVLYAVKDKKILPVKRSIFLSRFWLINSIFLFLKEKLIKGIFLLMQKTPLYKPVIFWLFNIKATKIESKEDAIGDEVLFRFYSGKRELGVARVDRRTLKENLFYTRFLFRNTGLDKIIRGLLMERISEKETEAEAKDRLKL